MKMKPTEGQSLNKKVSDEVIRAWHDLSVLELVTCKDDKEAQSLKIMILIAQEVINHRENERNASLASYKWHPQQDDRTRQEHIKRAFPEPDNSPLPESVMVALKRVASLSIAIRNARHPDKLINSLDSAEAALVAEIDSHASTICGKPDEGGGNGANCY